MCDNDYCEDCLPGDFIIAWTEGKHHTPPTFGDGAQQRVATDKRQEAYARLKKERPAEIMAFPEFLREHREFVTTFVAGIRRRYNFFAANIPALARYESRHPCPRAISARQYGKAGRKGRKRMNRYWRTTCLTNFLFEEGGAAGLRQMLNLVGRETPFWLQEVPVVETAELAAAA